MVERFKMTYTFDTQAFSDLYKEVNGFRPYSFHDFYGSDDFEKQHIWDMFIHQAEIQRKADQDQVASAVVGWLDEIDTMMSNGAEAFNDAVEWIVDASGEVFYSSQDVDAFVWRERLEGTSFGRRLSEVLLDVVTYEVA